MFTHVGEHETIVGAEVYKDYGGQLYTPIPRAYTGYGEDTVSVANSKAIESDKDMQESLGLVKLFESVSHGWYAKLDSMSDDKDGELDELLSSLMEYSILDDDLYFEVLETEQLNWIAREIEEDDGVEPSDVLDAIHDLGMNLIEDGENFTFYITESEFGLALEHAKAMAA